MTRRLGHSNAMEEVGVAPEDWRDWAGGLPADLLVKVAEALVAQNEAGWAARCKQGGSEWNIQTMMARCMELRGRASMEPAIGGITNSTRAGVIGRNPWRAP